VSTPGPPVESVVSWSASHDVISLTCTDDVVAAASVHRVIARERHEGLGEGVASHVVGPRRADAVHREAEALGQLIGANVACGTLRPRHATLVRGRTSRFGAPRRPRAPAVDRRTSRQERVGRRPSARRGISLRAATEQAEPGVERSLRCSELVGCPQALAPSVDSDQVVGLGDELPPAVWSGTLPSVAVWWLPATMVFRIAVALNAEIPPPPLWVVLATPFFVIVALSIRMLFGVPCGNDV
jgi:hypothetical protein